MKTWITILIALCACLQVQAQNTAEERAKAKEEARQEQAVLDSIYFKQAKTSLENQDFALEADRVVLRNGATAYVNSNTNFVAVKDDKATVQVAFNIPVSGPNGLGGITLDGSISNYKLTEDKKGNLHVSFDVMGVGISAHVTISLANGSNTADLLILPTFNSNELRLSGHILPLKQSSIFKGNAL